MKKISQQKKKSRASKAKTPPSIPPLNVETVAKVAASLVDDPSSENCTTYDDCDRAVEKALRLIERSSYAVEGRNSPTATEARKAYSRLWSVKAGERKLERENKEEDDFNDEISEVAEKMAHRLNGKTYRNRMIELGLVSKGATKSDVNRWEKKTFGDSPNEEDPFWKIIQRLKTTNDGSNSSSKSASKPSNFDPDRDWDYLHSLQAFVHSINSWHQEKVSEVRKESGKKLANHPDAKKKRKLAK